MTPILHFAVDVLLWHEDICCTIKLTSTAHPCKTGKVGMVFEVITGCCWSQIVLSLHTACTQPEYSKQHTAHSLHTASTQHTLHSKQDKGHSIAQRL